MGPATEITRQNLAAANVSSPVGVEVMEEVHGQYRGQQVQITSDASKLANEAEEVGMAIASRADRRSLGQRDIRAGRGTSAEALARTKGYYEKLPNMPEEAQLGSLVDLMTSYQDAMAGGGGGAPTKDDILAALHGFDQDVTHQFAALDILHDHFEASGADPAFMSVLDAARAEFEKSDVARDVRAGFAIAEVAARSAATLETDPATVRDTYRTMLRESMNFGQLFDALRSFDPLKKLGEAIRIFETAAGSDLASTGPSTDPLFLHGLLSELGKLKKVKTALESTDQLIRLTERSLRPTERGSSDVAEQASRILNFASRPTAGPADAEKMLGSFERLPLGVQMVYGNGLRAIHGELPDEVMPSPAARLQQNTAIVSFLDRLVAKEEAEFAAKVKA